MSGVEVAGLVLGALPMLIAALGQFKAGRGLVATLLRWRLLAGDIIHALGIQKELFHLSLKGLLRDAGLQEANDCSVAKCISILRRENTKTVVDEYLSTTATVFEAAVNKNLRCLEVLIGLLFQIPTSSADKSDFLLQLVEAYEHGKGQDILGRLQFIIDKRKIEVLLETITAQTTAIGQIIDRRKSLVSVEGVRSFSTEGKDSEELAVRLRMFRDSAVEFCHSYHRSMIVGDCSSRLHPAIIDLLDCGARLTPRTVPTGLTARRQQPRLPMYHVHLAIRQYRLKRSSADSCTSECQTLSSHLEYLHQNQRKLSSYRVGLDLEERESSGHRPGPHVECWVSSLVVQYGSGATCKKHDDRTELTVSTLHDVCDGMQLPMTPKQQADVACGLAYATLSCWGTAFLPRYLDRDAIAVASSQSKELLTIDRGMRPLLRRDLTGSSISASVISVEAIKTKDMLLQFASLLMEIYHGSSLESWAEEAGHQLTPETTPSVLTYWLEQTYPSMTRAFVTAVDSCLVLCAGLPPNWEDEEFQIRYCADVVLPLQRMQQAL